MPKLKNLLSMKRKSPSLSKKGQKEDQMSHNSNLSLASLPDSKNGSCLALSGSMERLGAYMLKEKDLSKFLKAAWNGDLVKLKQIASKKVNWNECDKQKRTALHLACCKSHTDVVDFLVTHGANVNLSDSEGKTPLIKACESNSTKIVECLLNNACETNVFDANQITAFHYAAGHGNIDIGYLLADNNAKLDPKDRDGVTPLHISCEMGHKSFVEFLLSEYVGIDCVDSQRRTPLMIACMDGNSEIAQLLIDNNADLSLTNKDGKTAEELANENNQARIVDLLDKHNKKNEVISSPVSNSSKKSAKELFSPAAKSLNDIFSSKSSTPSHESIFGGPAVNVHTADPAIEKSEDSKSEDPDDHSWADSDDLASSNDFNKKPNLLNIKELMKKKELEKGKTKSSDVGSSMSEDSSPEKEPLRKPSKLKSMKSFDDLSGIPEHSDSSPGTKPKTKSTEDLSKSPKKSPPLSPSKIPKLSGGSPSPSRSKKYGDVKESAPIPQLSESTENKSSDDDINVVPKNITPKKTIGKKLPWQQDDISDESESEWDDDIEKDFTAGVVKSTDLDMMNLSGDTAGVVNKDDGTLGHGVEVKNIPTFTAPPPPQFEKSNPSSDFDFDSSQPNDSFSDFPLSDMDGPSERKQSADDVNIIASPEHFQDDGLATGEDRPQSRQSIIDTKESRVKSPIHGVAERPKTPALESEKEVESENESDWDSHLSEISKVVTNLPPAPPPPANFGSDFDSSSEEEPESEFDLDKHTQQKGSDDGEPMNIFQTEVITPRDGKSAPDNGERENNIDIEDDDDDEIEKQMKELATSQFSPRKNDAVVKSPSKSKTEKAEGVPVTSLDFDISEVSDPEGFSDYKNDGVKKLDDNNNLLDEKELTKSDIFDAAGIIISESTEMESESEWEKELLQKRLSAATNRESDESILSSDGEIKLQTKKEKKKKIDSGKKVVSTDDGTNKEKVGMEDNIQQDIVLCGENSAFREDFNKDVETNRHKDHGRIAEFEANRKAHEDLLAAEIADELKKEMMEDMDVDLDSSSDFSFTPDFNPSPIMEGGDDENELSSLSDKGKIPSVVSPVGSVVSPVGSVVSPVFQRPAEINYDSENEAVDGNDIELDNDDDEKDREIKEIHQNIVRSSVVSTSPEKLDQLIDQQSNVNDELKRRFGLDAKQERDRIINEAMFKKEQIEKDIEVRMEVVKLEENRLREEETRLKKEEKRLKKLEEQERIRNEKIADDEKRLLLLKEEQEKQLEKQVRDRMEALNNMEVDLKKRAEDDLQKLLEAEDHQRRKKLSVDEKEFKKDMENERSRMKEEFGKEMKLKEELWEKQQFERELEVQRMLSDMKADQEEELGVRTNEKTEFIQKINELEEKIKKEYERKEILEKTDDDKPSLLEIEELKREYERKLDECKREWETEVKDLNRKFDEERSKIRAQCETELKLKEETLLKQMKDEEAKLRKKLEEMETQCGKLEKEIKSKETQLMEEMSRLEKEYEKEENEGRMKHEQLKNDEKRIMLLNEEQKKEMCEISEKRKEIEKMEMDAIASESKANDLLKEAKQMESDAKVMQIENEAKEDLLKKEYKEKEQELARKFAEMRENQMKELDKQAKIKQEEILRKIKAIEQEKEKEWKDKEEFIDQTRSSMDEHYHPYRLKEFETKIEELRKREVELKAKSLEIQRREEEVELKMSEMTSTEVVTEEHEVIEETTCDINLNEIKAKKDSIEKEIKRRKEELEKEEQMRLKIIQEELLRKEEYENELGDKQRNRRKLSDEEREFRKKLEQEREMKLLELIKKMEIDRVHLQSEFERELKLKDEVLQRQMHQKEQVLFSKLREIESRNLKEMELLAKSKEGKVLDKLKNIEEEKRKEWEKMEEDSLEKLEREGAKHKKNRCLIEMEFNREHEKRFQELERNYRKREDELEMQLADLRDKQSTRKGQAVETVTEVKQTNFETGIPDGFESTDGTPFISNSSSEEQLKLPPHLYRASTSGRRSEIGGSGTVGFNEHLADIQKELFDSRRQTDAYKEKANVLERVGREMQYDMEEMHKMIEVLNHSHKEKDKRCHVVEGEMQSVKFKLDKEREEKEVSEKLCKQLRDQLDVIEARLTSESELRQSLYLQSEKQKHDLVEKDLKIERLESENKDLKLELQNEKQVKTSQEERYKEKIHEHELALFEMTKTSSSHAEAVNRLEASDETRRQAESANQLLQVELAQTKAELSRTQSLLDEIKSNSGEEVTKLREKLEVRTEKLGIVEKNLFQVEIQYENEKSRRSSLEEKLATSVQSESNIREKMEEEVAALKRQLDKSKSDFDELKEKFSSVDHQRESITLKMDNEKSYIERDLAIAKEQLKVAEMKLSDSEAQIKTLNEELKTVGLRASEKSGDATNIRNVLEETKNNATLLETSLREEKMMSNKLESKLETANERISLLQCECDKLTKELMSVKEEYANRDRSAIEKQDSTNIRLTTMKETFNQEKTELILKNEQNNLLIDKLQNQLAVSEEKLKEKSRELSQIIQEANETNKDLSTEKADKSQLNSEIRKLTQEKSELKDSVENLHANLKAVTDEKNVFQIEANDLRLELEKSKEVCAEMTQRVQKKISELERARMETQEVKSTLQELKRLKCAVETDLREEKTRAESVNQDLQDSNRVMELEKQVEEMKKELEEEKRKARKAIDSKKSSDDKNEMFEKRSLQHQQEVSALKNKLKQYQRRLKESEGNDSRIPTIRAEFDLERQAMSANLSKLRRQLDQLSERLSHEQEMRDAEEKKNREQLKELTDLKTNEKVLAYEQERLERKCREYQQELERQKAYYERNFCPTEEIEEFKKALETKARLDLNKKLQEVNMHLEEQSLAREAFDKLRDGIEKKTKTGFEETVNQLKNDLTAVKACLHEGIVKRDTSLMEAHRFKELYESERVNSEKLSEQLVKTNERLNLERNRTNYLFDETMNKSKVTKKLFEESLEKDRKNSLSPRLQDDLGFNYYRPKLWSTPVASASKSPYTSPDPVTSIKRRNLLS